MNNELKNQSIINYDDTAYIDRSIDITQNKDYYDRSKIVSNNRIEKHMIGYRDYHEDSKTYNLNLNRNLVEG